MLKLKKLELHGFKSFCDREQLQFNGGGIAAIVGPNGCGKSNVSDSISWVLGERSAKSLRGSQMRDVIFNGSRDRKPSGLATVSLTLVDPEAYLANKQGRSEEAGSSHPALAEITVTRKLFRSGESDYLLNGKSCRLRDIQDLFMGTGLGPEHYAIIEQGRIGQILSSRPLDRCGFVEEAAGVTKFKAKKRLAELKLESARQNLHRVNDILQEVSRQVNSLKRQASKARRYEEVRQQLAEALSLVLASRYREMDRQAQQAAAEMQSAEQEYRGQAHRVSTLETELAENRRKEQNLETTLEQRRGEVSHLTVEIERLRSRLEQQAAMADENQKRKQQAEGEIVHLEERLETLRTELRQEEAAVEAVAAQTDEVRRQLQAKTAELHRQQAVLAESEQQQEASRHKVLLLLGELSSLRNQLAKIEEFLAGNERHISRVQQEETAAETELSELDRNRALLQQQIDTQQGQIEQVIERRNSVDRHLADLKKQAQEHRSEADRLQQELSKLSARRDSLEEILSHHAYTTETVKNLFSVIQRDPVAGFEPIGILADYVEVDPRYEKATEQFLHEELEYVVVKSWQEAQQGIQLLRRELQGYATFLVHPESPVTAETPALGPETGVAGRLADYIQLTNGLSGSASTLLPRLRSCYLVQDEDAARRLAVQYPDLHFLVPNGLCYRGYTLSGGKKTVAGPLALKRELRELRPRISEIEQRLAAVASSLAAAEEQIGQQTETIETLRRELQDLEKAALAGDHQLRQLNDHADRAQRRLAVARLEIERLRQEEQRASDERQSHQQSIEQREQERQAAEGALEALRRTIEEAQQTRLQLAEEQTGLRTGLATLEERSKAASAALDRAQQLTLDHEQRRDRIAGQIRQWETERERLLADNQQVELQIAEHTARHQQLRQEAAAAAEQLEASRNHTLALEQEVRTIRVDLESARERRSAIELRLVQLRSDLKHLGETCQRELDQPIAAVVESRPEELTEEEVAAAEQRYRELQQKIESLGPVNVLALQEYEESQQRLDFLETQRTDLLESIRDTQQAITEIDSASRRQFEQALDAINRNFREIFRNLFGGGVAEMRLSDEENPGESGVDIVASPPGKRLQNIALLSGGEKSLTALALLMATFRYRPSPFCILDEVDAALDEANLYRFRRLLQEMSGQTQFILITHSKTTMEVAQTLYGITMAEPGVSKLVSVRLTDHESEQATGPDAAVDEAIPVGA